MHNLIKLLLCIAIAYFFTYRYIDKSNELTSLRLAIPKLAKEVQEIKEKNLELQYAVEQFESSSNLLELWQTEPLAHLKFPDKNSQLTLNHEL